MQYILSSLQYLLSFFQKEVDESEIEVSESFLGDLQLIATFFKFSPQVIYFPGSGRDITPKKAFPKAKVIFVDKDSEVTESLKKAGCKYVFHRKAERFHSPFPADLTIMNENKFDEQSIKNTKKRGYIICTDRYGVASTLNCRKDVEIVGVISDDKVDDDFLGDYFEPASNDGDLRRAGVYNIYRKSIATIDPEVENIMEFIRKDYMKIMGTETYLGVALNVAKGDVSKVLPRKRGTQDTSSGFGMISNICIFQKK